LVDLQDMMLKAQRAVQDSEEMIGGLRKKITTAMRQRNVLLSCQSRAQLEEEAAVAAAAKTAQEEARAQAQARKEAAAAQANKRAADGAVVKGRSSAGAWKASGDKAGNARLKEEDAGILGVLGKGFGIITDAAVKTAKKFQDKS